MVQIHIKREGDIIALRRQGNNAYVPVADVTYTADKVVTIFVRGTAVFAGHPSLVQVDETVLTLENADSILSSLLFTNTGVTDAELTSLLTEALSPNRVARADDLRSVHVNARKHGISDIDNLDGLPVATAGSVINCAHGGYRNGQNTWGEQIFLPQTFASLFLRKMENGKFSSWRKALTSSDDQVGNINDFGEFMTVVNQSQANKPGNQNGLLLSMPYYVYRPDYKWGCQIYITEVTQEMYFRCKNNNVWGPWKKVLTNADRIGERIALNLTLNASTGITLSLNGGVAKFVGYRQANGDYMGFAQVDASINFAANANWNGVTLVSLPTGWQLVESHQACGDLFTTGTGGHFWKLWSECDEPGTTALIKSWNNNADIPRGTALRLMYNFPCIIRETPPAA